MIEKIIGWVALIIAILGAFSVNIPYAAGILVVLGIVGGWFIIADQHVRVMISALVLTALSSVLANIPAVGGYLAAIFAALGTFAAGMSLMIISRNVWARYKP